MTNTQAQTPTDYTRTYSHREMGTMEKAGLPETMRQAATQSLTEQVCMFCGQPSDDFREAEDWDGNIGLACPNCRNEDAA